MPIAYREMDGDRSKRDNTRLFHFRRSAEKIEKSVGNQLEGGCTAEHHADRKQHGIFKGFVDSPFVFGSIVESQDRDQTVVKAEYRHKEKALELKIHTENSRRGRREGDQDQIHQVGHD